MSSTGEYHPGPGWQPVTAEDVAAEPEVIAQPWEGVCSHLSGVRLVALGTTPQIRYVVRSDLTGARFGVFACWKRQPAPEPRTKAKPATVSESLKEKKKAV